MSEMDDLLGRLAATPVPPGIESIEGEVLRRVESHSFVREPLALRIGVVGIALIMGVAGGLLSNTEARAGARPIAIADGAGLAPSTLLAGR